MTERANSTVASSVINGWLIYRGRVDLFLPSWREPIRRRVKWFLSQDKAVAWENDVIADWMARYWR